MNTRKNVDDMEDEDILDEAFNNIDQSKKIKNRHFFTKPLSERDKLFVERLKQTEVEAAPYNPHLPILPGRLALEFVQDKVECEDRTERAIFNRSVDDFQDVLTIQEEVFQSLLTQEQQKQLMVGRIIHLGTFVEKQPLQGKQSQIDFWFQSFTSKITKKLDLSKLTQYFLYPGKMVAIEVSDLKSGILEVLSIHDFPFTSIEEMEDTLEPVQYNLRQQLQVFVAAGPFTSEDSERYQPLITLLDKLSRQTCDILILLGPFVTDTNEVFKDPFYELEYQQVYDYIITMVQEELPDTQIIVVDSNKDITRAQPLPLSSNNQCQSGKDVKFASNPSQVILDGTTVIQIINSDVLNLMRTQSYMQGEKYKQRPVASIFHEMLAQRSCIPIYTGLNEKQQQPSEYINQLAINEDFSLAWQPEYRYKYQSRAYQETRKDDYVEFLRNCHQDYYPPQIVIVPTQSSAQAINVDGTLFICPQSLLKGTYVHAVIHSNEKKAVDRTRVEILAL